MKCRRIVSIGLLPDYVRAQFEPEYEILSVSDSSREEVVKAMDETVIAVIARGSVYFDGELMDRAPGLKLIARTGVGYDSVSIEEATDRGLPVTYTPGAMSRSVGELTLSLILAACKKLNIWRQALQDADWNLRYLETSQDLEGKILGIIGYGRIGRQVRMLSRGFGLRTLANDPYIDHSSFADDDITFVSFEDLLQQANIITLHVPLTGETRGLINRQNIGLIQPGSVLINTARGPVIESLDLLHKALEKGPLGAVGLDVSPDEPPDAAHPIFRHTRAYVTGHIAARTPLSQQRILETMVREVRAILNGTQPNLANIVNPEVLEDQAGSDSSSS